MLIVTFLAEDFFFDNQGSDPIEKGSKTLVELPPQLTDQQDTEVAIAEEISRDTIVAYTANFILEYIMRGSMSEIWMFIN